MDGGDEPFGWRCRIDRRLRRAGAINPDTEDAGSFVMIGRERMRRSRMRDENDLQNGKPRDGERHAEAAQP